jgi:CHAT domain-containing protein/predicted negative regulator of RcsB-dependent stress response
VQGEIVSRELSGDRDETFKIPVSENQYFHIVVEQLGIALVVTLNGPKGAPIVQTQSQSGAHGPLYISEIAPVATDYILRVSAAETWANPGRYQITLDTVRTSEPRDRELIAAERALAEGQGLLANATEQPRAEATETRRRAIRKFTEAADGFHDLKDLHGEVMSRHLIGVTYQRYLSESTEAKQVLSQALELAKDLAANDWRLQATILNDLGEVYRTSYDQQQARSMFGNALRIFEAHGDRRGKASVSNNLGLSYSSTGDGREAIELFQTALQIRKLEHDKETEVLVIGNLASAYDALGEFHQALLFSEQALRGWRELNRADRVPNSLNNIAVISEKLGLWQQAIDYYQEALATVGKSGSKGIQAAILFNLGDLYGKLNDSSRALENYEKSLTLRRELKNHGDEANVLAHIGTVHISLNNLAEALKYLEQALQIEKSNPTLNLSRIQAFTLIGIGEVHRQQSKFAEALNYFEGARKLAEAVGDRQQESDSQQKLGESYVALGAWSQAQESYDKALALRRRLEDKLGEAATLYHIASLKRDLNQLPEAATVSATALKLFEALRGSIISQQLRTSYFETTQRCFELYIDVKLSLYRIDSDDRHLAEAVTANERAHARSLVDALANTSPEIVQGVSPIILQKQRALVENLNSKAQNRQALLNESEVQQRAYYADHRKDQLQALTKTEHRLASLAVYIKELISEADDVETQILRESPRYAALTEPQSLNLNQIQSELDENTLLLEYSLGERRSFAFVVTATSIKAIELPRREEIETVARRLGASVTARNSSVNGERPGQRKERLDKANTEYTKAAARLSQMVIDPVAPLLKEQRILVVADGELQLLPFNLFQLPVKFDQAENSAEVKSPRFLIQEHEIITLPSASVLAVLRRELQGRKTAPYAVAVLANPVFASSDPRVRIARKAGTGRSGAGKLSDPIVNPTTDLSKNVKHLPESVLSVIRSSPVSWLPYSRDEAKAIEEVAPVGQTMLALDFKASRTTAISPALSQYRIVHFATHGITDPDHPELSGIILSLVDENGVEQDGYLRLHEIYNLNLPAELVVISACESGVGKQFKGEGLIALTRGFMYAGAARVIASLWKVDDAATAALMTELYKEMFTNGKKPAAALRAAQLSISKQKRWREPYFWAGFVIQGEWR